MLGWEKFLHGYIYDVIVDEDCDLHGTCKRHTVMSNCIFYWRIIRYLLYMDKLVRGLQL